MTLEQLIAKNEREVNGIVIGHLIHKLSHAEKRIEELTAPSEGAPQTQPEQKPVTPKHL